MRISTALYIGPTGTSSAWWLLGSVLAIERQASSLLRRYDGQRWVRLDSTVPTDGQDLADETRQVGRAERSEDGRKGAAMKKRSEQNREEPAHRQRNGSVHSRRSTWHRRWQNDLPPHHEPVDDDLNSPAC